MHAELTQLGSTLGPTLVGLKRIDKHAKLHLSQLISLRFSCLVTP